MPLTVRCHRISSAGTDSGASKRDTPLPMILVQAISIWTGVVKLSEFYQSGNFLLVVIDAVVLITSLMVMLEAGR